MKSIWEAKEQRRKELAAKPIHEKVQMLIRLQRMAAPLLHQRGRRVRVWEME